jgi:NTE family protein
MTSRQPSPSPSRAARAAPAAADEECILVLQGGGALGAYQAGVFESLAKVYREPTWVAGISIGAINAALIAGNPAPARVAKLREFWDLVSSALPAPLISADPFAREGLNEASANQVMWFGVPGFFRPRFPPAPFQSRGSLQAISYYDTAPLRETLERLVDFDRINAGPLRLSVGAVNVRTGNFAYFDSAKQRIDARHVMASGALPPGFAPIEIDGEHYWDGGLVSNTPLQYVLDNRSPHEMNVYQVDLFSSRGIVPQTMADIAQREKDIRFSSRTRLNTDMSKALQKTRAAARRLRRKLPAEFHDDPDLMRLLDSQPAGAVAVMHLINRAHGYETNSKDYEFSRMTVEEHWGCGRFDAQQSLGHPEWVNRDLAPDEIVTFDLAGERSGARLRRPLASNSDGEAA